MHDPLSFLQISPQAWLQQVGSPFDKPLCMITSWAQQALQEADGSQAWLRAVMLDHDCPERIAASFGKALESNNTKETVDKLAILLQASADPWVRFIATEALQGPWASEQVKALELALQDDEVLFDMWAGFRIMDEAAVALSSLGVPHDSKALQFWIVERRQELSSQDSLKKELTVFVLARLGFEDAILLLETMANRLGIPDITNRERWPIPKLVQEVQFRQV